MLQEKQLVIFSKYVTNRRGEKREGKCRLKQICQLMTMCGKNTCKIYEPIGEKYEYLDI